MTLKMQLENIARDAKNAAEKLALMSQQQKNNVLQCIADSLHTKQQHILEINNSDVETAKQQQLSSAMIDRLQLTPQRFNAIIDGLQAIIALPDPVGNILKSWTVPSGLHIKRVSMPLGVIGVIYESRPNVTVDAAALCLKSGNAVILRGGSECAQTNRALLEAIQQGLSKAACPIGVVSMIPTQDRAAVGEMVKMTEFIDVIIPRGGKSLVQRLSEESRIPLFKHLDGNCHTYIHEDADLQMAIDITYNAKLRRPGICGATETLLIDEKIAPTFVKPIVDGLQQGNCEIRGDKLAQSLDERILPASEEDWSTEYLDKILALKIVKNMDEALNHIRHYGSSHTEAIITQNQAAADKFFQHIQSAIVMHNCSTQFADGGEFGMGAEIGISTGKLHARGPIGLEQLTTFKYVVQGKGQVRN